MTSELLDTIKLLLTFIPFLVFAFINSKLNMKRKIRCRQFFMPVVAFAYCILLFILLQNINSLLSGLVLKATNFLENAKLYSLSEKLREIYSKYLIIFELVVFNTAALFIYIIIKGLAILLFRKAEIPHNSLRGKLVGLFYSWDEQSNAWYIRPGLGQAKTLLKVAYVGGLIVSIALMLVSYSLINRQLIAAPFYPVFAVILIGELSFFVDGRRKDEQKSELSVSSDNADHIAMYPLLKKPLRALFGDKLSSEGTTVNDYGQNGGSAEDVLTDLENNGGHVGKNYAAYIRSKVHAGLKPNIDFMRSGFDLASGKSLLFSTPFYYKLIPYAFYAMSRTLIKGEKVLIVLGRHGITDDINRWCKRGMLEVSNIPDLWKIGELTQVPNVELDIGIVPCSAVHDLRLHKANLSFLKQVSFIFIVEPSRLVTTAQIGLNLLVKCCGKGSKITFCSVDINCDGLVDSLSHIFMTDITEVSATEYPQGTSTYMFWNADNDYLQHRLVPGISRYLGMGTELSFVALKNQVRQTTWYGGGAFPVKDAHWIAKQYYYNLLDYATLPTTQETFDKCFSVSYNMCDVRMEKEAYLSVEDERNNVFETKRNFATITNQQGFVNVISSEYMLREYMTENDEIFHADSKAIPYIAADYAKTRRNSTLSLCLKLCVDGIKESELKRELMLMGLDSQNPESVLWKKISELFSIEESLPSNGDEDVVITVPSKSGNGFVSFLRSSTILFSRRYSTESGSFESIYTVENPQFAGLILDDLQSAVYIAEQTDLDTYLGSELKGHIYQKYLPGQFITLNGKYYEMVSVTFDNRILVRRASDHISGRVSYRQIRKYYLDHVSNVDTMGALKTINDIDIYRQFASFRVETPAYWAMSASNDFVSANKIVINGVPDRHYYNKEILKLDFSKIGDAFTDNVRVTLTTLINEVFATIFADNQPYICAVTPGNYRKPLSYSLECSERISSTEKCIYIIEDSQLDIGLLVAVERNLNRIFQIISDYLAWNEEMIESSLALSTLSTVEPLHHETVSEAAARIESNLPPKKKNIFARIKEKIKNLFKCKKKNNTEEKEKKKKEKAEKAAEKRRAKEERKTKKEAARRKGSNTDGTSDNSPEEAIGNAQDEPLEKEQIDEQDDQLTEPGAAFSEEQSQNSESSFDIESAEQEESEVEDNDAE